MLMKGDGAKYMNALKDVLLRIQPLFPPPKMEQPEEVKTEETPKVLFHRYSGVYRYYGPEGSMFWERLREDKELIARRKLHDTRQRTVNFKCFNKKKPCSRSNF